MTKTFTARHLPLHRGPAAWSAILPGQAPPQPLEADTTADFVVIGAGFAGMAAARRVTQLAPGARIAVLEAGRVAEGAAGRNSGFMIDLPHELTSEDYAGAGDDRAMIDLNRQAQAFARAAVDDYGISPDHFDQAGKVNGAVSDAAHAHNESYARHLASLGEASEALDAQAMRELTGSSHYQSGLYTPGTVMLQPAGFIRGMARGLRRDGVEIYEQSPVQTISRRGSDWACVTPKGTVTTPRVILSVNGHLESFGVERGRLMQLFLFATMTPELSHEQITALGGAPRWGITPSDPMGTTIRRIDKAQGGNRIITRTGAVLRPGMVARKADMARAARVMQEKFDARFPQFKGMRMAHTWAGHLCLSLNGVSVMREVAEGVFSACVQNGLGTTRGTLTGMGAAELACGQSTGITAHFTAEASPKRLPPQPFREWGANAVLRLKEWQVREE
jgi:glycine/D-amino acid oxidase-like deaminating enzyme